MCESCDIDCISDAELAPYAGEESDRYRGLVLAEAVRIVLFKRRMTRNQLGAAMGIAKTTIYRLANGDPIKRPHFIGYMAVLEAEITA